jgi:hypothetical protein
MLPTVACKPRVSTPNNLRKLLTSRQKTKSNDANFLQRKKFIHS